MKKFDYECSTCFTRHLDVTVEVEEHKELCEICSEAMRRIFLTPPAIRAKTITNVERGIKKDCIEMARLDDIAARTKDKNTKREIAREINRINTTEVKHPTERK